MNAPWLTPEMRAGLALTEAAEQRQGGGTMAEGGVSSSAPLSVARLWVQPIGTHGMHLSVLEDAPCQSVVLSEADGIDARCRYTLAHHPRMGDTLTGAYRHEDEGRLYRWYLDDEGDIHLAVQP